MISYAVVGHQQRILEATALGRAIGGVLALDDGSVGAGANHCHAWELTGARPATWAAVLEDDAQPVPGFTTQAHLALSVAPTPVVSFYLGTTRPKRWQDRIPAAMAIADRAGAHWLTATQVLHAVGVAIHADLVEDWLDFAYDRTHPIDERLTQWCGMRDHEVAYSLPSLVDHADGPTLIPPNPNRRGDGPRRAWRTGTRDTWTSRASRL